MAAALHHSLATGDSGGCSLVGGCGSGSKGKVIAPKHVIVDESLDRICSALFALDRISPNHPENSPTPFGLLGLDAYAEPFYPVEKSVYPGSEWHAAAHETIQKATERLRELLWAKYLAGDQAAVRTVDALWHVGYMLLYDDSRAYFLRVVQPRLDGSGSLWNLGRTSRASTRVSAVRQLCLDAWALRGW
ncbi:hypothetical protein ColLi_13994 [Colletotrichum liriopes]|uniref:Uncharacterized protein n=1 Tax=Colletotrichum liriopes TaxID=708192 RepID=A0AA37H190_9PEZI|nr:hypothetical protein ColLi_13994 [Colletotrichum liriopes]